MPIAHVLINMQRQTKWWDQHHSRPVGGAAGLRTLAPGPAVSRRALNDQFWGWPPARARGARFGVRAHAKAALAGKPCSRMLTGRLGRPGRGGSATSSSPSQAVSAQPGLLHAGGPLPMRLRRFSPAVRSRSARRIILTVPRWRRSSSDRLGWRSRESIRSTLGRNSR